MDTLLSPAESTAFQTFLSSIDYPDTNDWALYNSSSQPETVLVDVPQSQGKEALAKATKDLMSLDTDHWDSPTPYTQNHLHPLQHQDHQQLIQRQPYEPQQPQRSFSHHDLFPFLHKQRQHPQQQQPQRQHQQHAQLPQVQRTHIAIPHIGIQHQQQHQQQHPTHNPLALPPLHPIDTLLQPGSHRPGSATSPTSATNPFSYPPSASSPHPPLLASGSTTKRPQDTTAPTSAAKRSRPSPPSSSFPHPNGVLPSASSSSNNNNTPLPNGHTPAKQTLLSPSQKKANHIQSEQKRRANIRRGYEALCDTVPALREAIREEEEAEARGEARVGREMSGDTQAAKVGKGGKGRRGKKGREDPQEKERIDGRAGPRSENVVLSKTIDYITDLLSERESLLAQLKRAQAGLPPGHPMTTPGVPEPLWDRKWKGGEGKIDEEEEEGDGEGDYMESQGDSQGFSAYDSKPFGNDIQFDDDTEDVKHNNNSGGRAS